MDFSTKHLKISATKLYLSAVITSSGVVKNVLPRWEGDGALAEATMSRSKPSNL